MKEADDRVPAALTVGILYLMVAGVLVGFLFALTAVGLPAALPALMIGVLAAGFPVAVLLAVILRPRWTRTAREAGAAALSLYFR